MRFQYLRFQHLNFKCILMYFNAFDNINGETENMQFTTWQCKISDFRISKYLSGLVYGFYRSHTRFQGHW